MIEGTIAIRYARALIDIARGQNNVDAYREQIKAFNEVCEQNKELMAVLSNRLLAMKKRNNIIAEVAGKINVSQDVQNFLKLLVLKGRMSLLPEVTHQYIQLADLEMGRQKMIVTTATELDASIYDELQKYFSTKLNKTMIVEKKIKPEVLGGVSVQVGDRIFDSTIERQLNDLKQSLVHRA